MKQESSASKCRQAQKGSGSEGERLAQPLRGRSLWAGRFPRVARSSQPWAEGLNPFGIAALRAGFTLIELMLVMAVLTIAVAIAAPALSHFFRGRSLESQARMLVALTRHAQSRAASEGLPMELWVDTQKSEIGLEAEPSYDQVDPKAMTFTLENNARIEVMNVDAKQLNPVSTSPTTQTSTPPKVLSRHPGIPRIRFMPDGTLDDQSPLLFKLTSNEGDILWLAQTRSRLSYEVRTTN